MTDHNLIITQICHIVDASTAIGAPGYSADWMLSVAQIIGNKIDALVSEQGPLADLGGLDQHMEILMKGARASMAYIVCPLLPKYIQYSIDSDEPLDGETMNESIIAAQQLCRQYQSYPDLVNKIQGISK